MAKECYKVWVPSTKVREGQKLSDRAKVATMQAIVDEYNGQGLKLTGRQLYYQFVSRDMITNTERSYKNLLELLVKARYGGLVDWDAIEDRGRRPTHWREFTGPRAAVDSVTYGYRLPRWADQPCYVELWVEKQALAGVLERPAYDHHVVLMVNKGYSSATAMYEAAGRFKDANSDGKECHLLYLGDHDPSGEDMVRDVRDRLADFGATVEVEKVALTMAQVDQYQPPPNPAKLTDSRAGGYVAEHGQFSWEVDALPPPVLDKLIRQAIGQYVDDDVVAQVREREAVHVAAIKRVAAQLGRELG